MEEILSKRLMFLSRIVIVLFALSLFSLIHKFDSYDLEKDIKAFDLIAHVNKTDVSSAIQNGELYTKSLDYLNQADPALAAQQRDVREKVTNMLAVNYGVSEDTIAAVKGRISASTNRFSLIEIPWDDASESLTRAFRSSQTVDDFLSRFRFLTEPRSLRVATAFEGTSLPVYEASLSHADTSGENRDSPFLDPMTCLPEFAGAILKNNALEISFADLSYAGQRACGSTDTLPITTVEIPGPSLFALLNGDSAEINQLRDDQNQLNRIQILYGQLEFYSAQTVAVQDFTQAYKSITILGFSFSTRRYPEAMLLFTLLTVAGILLTVGTARRASQNVISGVNEVDLVDSLLDNPVIRFILWSVLPPVAILASLPMYPLGETETVVFYAGAVLTAVLGLVAFVSARNL